jgi:hypothetical protein
MEPMSQLCPAKWTGMTALVFFVIFFLIFSGDRLYVLISMSEKMGVALQ